MEGHAAVLAPPPVLLLAAWTVASLLHRFVPLSIARDHARARQIVGGATAAASACLSASVVRCFARAATPVSPLRATRALVADGPYRYSRNPDYLGQTGIFTGAGIASNRLWPLVMATIERSGIRPEEQYLERRFGEAYREYAWSVPRWI